MSLRPRTAHCSSATPTTMAADSNPFEELLAPLPPEDPWHRLRLVAKDRLRQTGERAAQSIRSSCSDDPAHCIYDSKTGFPVVSPLSSLEAVLSWVVGRDDMSVASVPLSPRAVDPFAGPNVLVCHDMMGGYTNDRFIQGCGAETDYYFYHWQHISTFVYFSHHFVSIPPPSWTNAAHRNGVLCLGTVITEWQDGASLCSRLLSNELIVEQFVDQLIQLAVYYNFDGWLINIENPVHSSQLDNLMVLLTLLTTGMHQAIDHSKVIWYDSVTSSGELQWQNKLNEKNMQYFDVCDGIFLNYHWTRGDLHATRTLAGETGSHRVYVGVDVFGRGCFGGGGYNTQLALELIEKHGLSSAIFAPGWVYENNSKSEFFSNNDKFWSSLSPHCPTYAHSKLPLISSFTRGRGRGLYVNGQVAYEGVWSNSSAQGIQLSFTDKLYQNNQQCSVSLERVSIEDDGHAYNNGSFLCVKGRSGQGSSTHSHTPSSVRLFKTDIMSDELLLISYTFSCSSPHLKHHLRLRTDGPMKFLALSPLLISSNVDMTRSEQGGVPVSPIMESMSNYCGMSGDIYAIVYAVSGDCQKLIHSLITGSAVTPPSTSNGQWATRYFVVNMSGRGAIKGISLSLYSEVEENFSLLVGEIKLLSAPIVCYPLLVTASGLVAQDVSVNLSLFSCTLVWSYTMCSDNDQVDHCNIYYTCGPVHRQLLGRAYCNKFSVVKLNLQREEKSVTFHVQAVTVSGQSLNVFNSSLLTIDLSNL